MVGGEAAQRGANQQKKGALVTLRQHGLFVLSPRLAKINRHRASCLQLTSICPEPGFLYWPKPLTLYIFKTPFPSHPWVNVQRFTVSLCTSITLVSLLILIKMDQGPLLRALVSSQTLASLAFQSCICSFAGQERTPDPESTTPSCSGSWLRMWYLLPWAYEKRRSRMKIQWIEDGRKKGKASGLISNKNLQSNTMLLVK